MMKRKIVFVLSLWGSTALAATGLIPNVANDFYYQLGGGQNVPMPAFLSTQTLSLGVDGSVGLGYNCGIFDQAFSITNALNGIKSSFQNIQQSVVNNAKAAIMEFPMYAISRADPSLYNLLNNGLLGARRDFELSTKNCQFMQAEIGQGKNPYQNWASISMGNDWKYNMGISSDSYGSGQNANAASDINVVSEKVQKDNGVNGVPWVQGTHARGDDLYAGGKGQPVILVTHDTAIAGYNVILQRDFNDTSSPSQSDMNDRLVATWKNPEAAAKWITNTTGDQLITTYPGGEKKSTPGIGLLPDTEALTKTVTTDLTALVSGQKALSLASLQAVAAPRVAINEAVITAIRQQNPVMQSIVINKLAQEVATARVIDKAQLALQIIEEGSQIPAIYGNEAAQKTLSAATTRLRKGIEDLIFNVKVNKSFVSGTVTELLQSTRAQQMSGAAIPAGNHPTPMMQNGAVMKAGG